MVSPAESVGGDRAYSMSSPHSNFVHSAWRSCEMDNSWPGYDFIGEVDRCDCVVVGVFQSLPGGGQGERLWARVHS